ncbi:hypothetical protein FJY94_03465 [Candidatus Kaiserbacteria bacterium]|nr:hypothetical protein [Candidatus Kaiserbacteria bacterium]
MARMQIVRKADYSQIKRLAVGQSVVIVVHAHCKAPILGLTSGSGAKPIECSVEYLETRLEMKKPKTSKARVRVTRR